MQQRRASRHPIGDWIRQRRVILMTRMFDDLRRTTKVKSIQEASQRLINTQLRIRLDCIQDFQNCHPFGFPGAFFARHSVQLPFWRRRLPLIPSRRESEMKRQLLSHSLRIRAIKIKTRKEQSPLLQFLPQSTES